LARGQSRRDRRDLVRGRMGFEIGGCGQLICSERDTPRLKCVNPNKVTEEMRGAAPTNASGVGQAIETHNRVSKSTQANDTVAPGPLPPLQGSRVHVIPTQSQPLRDVGWTNVISQYQHYPRAYGQFFGRGPLLDGRRQLHAISRREHDTEFGHKHAPPYRIPHRDVQ